MVRKLTTGSNYRSGFVPDGKRHSVMGKTRGEAIEKAEQELARWERGLDRNAKNKTLAAVPLRISRLLQTRWRGGAVDLPGLSLSHRIAHRAASGHGHCWRISIRAEWTPSPARSPRKASRPEPRSTLTRCCDAPCNSRWIGSTSPPTRRRPACAPPSATR